MARSATTLLEREGEIRELRDALAAAEEGHGQVVLIQGSAGLGKTSLLRAAVEAAGEAGFACLRARATELERDFAYGSVRQLLEPAVARVSEEERDRLFDGAAALSKPLFALTGDPPALPSADRAFSMLHGLYWLVNNIADERPVALAIDDIHWSDAESLRFVNYLAPRLDGLPLAVVASTRDGDEMTADLARLAAAAETTVVRPRPLSTGATATLCKRSVGTDVAPEFATACREATGGNPFYLEALLREVNERRISPDARGAERARGIGPAAVAEAVLLRLSERPAAATALIRAVAVLGDGASARRGRSSGRASGGRGSPRRRSARGRRDGEGRRRASSSLTRSSGRPCTRTSAPTNARRRTPERPRSSSSGGLPRSGSRPRSPPRSRPATPSGSSSCAAWPRTPSTAERRPPP